MNIKEKIKFFNYLAEDFDSRDYPPIMLWKSIQRQRIEEGWKQRVKEISSGEADAPGLYIHIPYCQTKCFFCQFKVLAGTDPEMHSRYLECLKNEMKRMSPLVKKLSFKTFYLAGGTPTIFSAEQLEDLFNTAEKRFNLSQTVQRLIEATPATLSLKKLRVLKKYGFNRITIGVEVIDKKMLHAINRQHQTEKMVKDSFEQARQAGIEFINTDLIAGLPGQSIDSFLYGVRFILKMRPDAIHIFTYREEELVIFCRIGKRITDKDRLRKDKMLALAEKMIRKAGYGFGSNEPYLLTPDAANFQLQYRYQYNVTLLGLGALALSFIPNHHVYHNAQIEDYLKFWPEDKATPFFTGYPISRAETRLNYVLNNIRNGLDKEQFFRLYGVQFDKTYQKEIEDLKRINRIKNDSEKVKLITKNDFEFRSYSKFFFGSRVIKELQAKIKIKPSEI
ncbi:MAG: radical SAM protein [Spirochaetes bacterium]|nr:radical SAM protein [Spirochaetota bacterium]